MCPYCNADLVKTGIEPWDYVAGVAGNVTLLLCMHCSKVLGVLPGSASEASDPLHIPGALT